MFESDQLDSFQSNVLAGIVIAIVTLSLMYFSWILFTEVWAAFHPNSPLLCMKGDDEDLVEEADGDGYEVFEHRSVGKGKVKGAPRDSTIITFEKPNPLVHGEFVAGGIDGEGDAELEDEFRESSGWELSAAHDRIDQLMRENADLKERKSANVRPSRLMPVFGFSSTSSKKKKPVLKKGFSSLDEHDNDDEDGREEDQIIAEDGAQL